MPVFPLISVLINCLKTLITSNRCLKKRCTAFRYLRQPGFRRFSTARRALHRTIVTIWARRLKFGVCLWLRDLTRPEFSHPAAPARSWPNGSGTDILQLTCGTWISAGLCHFSPTCVTCTTGQLNPLACYTRCTGHFDSLRPHVVSGAHRCMSTWSRRMPVSGKPVAGSDPTGLRQKDSNLSTIIHMANPIG